MPPAGALRAAGRKSDSANRVLLEPLEPRYLLSADLMPFSVAMDPGGDDFTLRLDAVTDYLQVLDNRNADALVAEQARGSTSEVRITGSDADDRLEIDLAVRFALPGGIHFDGGLGTDVLNIVGGVFDSVDHGLGGLGAGTVEQAAATDTNTVAYSGVEALSDTSDAGARSVGNDTGSAQTLRLDDAGAGDDGLIAVDDGGTGAFTGVTLAAPTDALTLQAGDAGDTIVLAGTDTASTAALGVEGGAGTDTLAGPDAANTWMIDGAGSGTLSGAVDASFAGIEDVTGGAGEDIFAVTASGSLAGTIDGGAGADTLAGPDTDSTWAITGDDAGTLNALAFSGIENLLGGAGDDTFRFLGGSISGSIDGGGGDNIFDYAAAAGDVTVDLGASSATGVARFDDITGIIGGTGDDTLVGPDLATEWTIDGTDSGTAAGVQYRDVENLQGGTQADRFAFGLAGELTGWLAGGLGLDTLSGADDANTWNVSAADAGTLNGRAFSGIEFLEGGDLEDAFLIGVGGFVSGSIAGGLGNDRVQGANQRNTWNVDGRNAGRLNDGGFSGIESLVGGNDADEFVFADGGSVDGGIAGGAGDDTLFGPAADSDWTIDGADAGSVAGAAFSGIENLAGAADNEDTFTFEAEGSLSGVTAGGDAGFDVLILRGGTYDSIAYTMTGTTSGTIERVSATSSDVILFTGFEPLGNDGTNADEIIFNLTSSADEVVLRDHADPGTSVLESVNDTFEDTSFANPDTSLTINLLGGDDTITVESLDPGFGASLTVAGGDDAALGDLVDVTGDVFVRGGDLSFDAETIVVHSGVTISTLDTDGAGESTGDSGSITLTGTTIQLQTDARLLAHVEGSGGHEPGDVTISASDTDFTGIPWFDTLFREVVFPLFGAQGLFLNIAEIDASGATIRGGDVSLSAIAEYDSESVLGTEIFDGYKFSDLFTFGSQLLFGQNIFSLPFGVLGRVADASVTLGGNTVIEASDDVVIESSARADGSTTIVNPHFSIALGMGFARAESVIGDTSVVTAGGDVLVASDGAALADVLTRTSTNKDKHQNTLSLAVSKTDLVSHATLEQGAAIDAGGVVNVLANGESSTSGNAEFAIYGDGTAGVTIGLAWGTSDVQASVDGRITSDWEAGGGITSPAHRAFTLAGVDDTPGSETIALADHGLSTGDLVIYSSGGADAIGNLVDGESYTVLVVDDNTVRLTRGPALGIDIAPAQSGSIHGFTPSELFEFDPNATVAGEPAVDVANDTLVLPGHPFGDGDEVTYTSLENIGIVGLSEGSRYVVDVDAVEPDRFRLKDPDAVRALEEAGDPDPVANAAAIDLIAPLFTLPGTSHGFVYSGSKQTFSPDDDATVDSDANAFRIDDHGFSTGDVIVYNVDGTVDASREVTQYHSFDPTLAFTGADDDSSVVDYANDRIVLNPANPDDPDPEAGAGLADGDRVIYRTNGDNPVGGLSDGTTYVVLNADGRSIQLAEESSPATPIALSPAADTGDLHQLVSTRDAPVEDPAISGLEDGGSYYVSVIDADTFRLAESIEEARMAAPIDLVKADAMGNDAHALEIGLTEGIGIRAELTSSEGSFGVSGIGGDPLLKDYLLKKELARAKTMNALREKLVGPAQTGGAGAGTGADTSEYSFAGAVVFTHGDHDVTAKTGPNAVLEARNDVEVIASQTATFQHAAEASISKPGGDPATAAISAGISVGVYDNDVQALVEGSTIDARNELLVDSSITYPFLTNPTLKDLFLQDELGDNFKPSNIGTLLDQKLGLQGKLFNTWTRSVSGGETAPRFGVAGSVTYLQVDTTSRARISDEARINRGGDPDYQSIGQSVTVAASTGMQLVNLAGVFDINFSEDGLKNLVKNKDPFAFLNPFGASGGKGGIGGSLFLGFVDNTTVAEIADAELQLGSAGVLDIDAATDIVQFNLAQSGASAETFGLSATFAYNRIENETMARIDNRARISGGSVEVDANDGTNTFNIGGGIVRGESVGVGVTIGVNDIDRRTHAVIGGGPENRGGPWEITFDEPGDQPGELSADPVPALDGALSFSTSTEGATARKEVQTISHDSLDGNLQLGFEGETTGFVIPALAPAFLVENALNDLQTIHDAGGVSVTGGAGDPWRVEFLADGDRPLITARGDAAFEDPAPVPGLLDPTVDTTRTRLGLPGVVRDVQTISHDASQGRLRFHFGGETTGFVAHDASAGDVQSALNALAAIRSAGGVTVEGGNGQPWVIRFNLNGPRLPILGEGDAAFNATGVDVFAVDEGAVDTLEVQELSQNATEGSFTLSYAGEGTGPLAHDAGAAEVEAALEALDEIDAVTVTGTAGGPWQIVFDAPGDRQQIIAEAVDGFDGRIGVDVVDGNGGAREVQTLAHDALQGSFTLSLDGGATSTGPLAHDASPEEIQAALNALASVQDAGGVTVTPVLGGGEVDADGDVTLVARADGNVKSFSLAASFVKEDTSNKFTPPAGGVPLPGLARQPDPPNKNGIAIAGDLSINDVDDVVEAYINNGVDVTGQGIALTSDNTTSLITGTGALAISLSGQQNSIGVAGAFSWNDLDSRTRAFVADARVHSLSQDLALTADRTGDLFALAAGGAGAPSKKGIAVAGSVAVNLIDNETTAFLTDVDATVGGGAILDARDTTDMLVIGGGVSFGGRAGVGAGFALNRIDSDTSSRIEGSTLVHGGDIDLAADNSSSIRVVAGAGGFSAGKLGLAGTVAVNLVDNETAATIVDSSNDGSASPGAVSLSARDDSTIHAIAGAVGGGRSAGLGVAVAYNQIDNAITASMDASQLVGSTITIDAGATSTIKTISAGGAGAGRFAFAGAVSVNQIRNAIDAGIIGDSTVTAAGTIGLTASDDSTLWALSGNVAGAGRAAIGASVGYNNIDNTVTARIDGDTTRVVSSGGHVRLLAQSATQLRSIAAGGQGAGSVAIGGSVSINHYGTDVEARIGDGTSVDADGSVTVEAVDDATFLLIAGVISGAGTAAVGASNTTLVTDGTVQAHIDDAVVQADGNGSAVDIRTGEKDTNGDPATESIRGVAVTATSHETVRSFAVTGTGAGTAAIAGSATVNVLDETTSAYIADGARINDGGVFDADNANANAAQDVVVRAADETTLVGVAGGLAGAGTAAVGAGADVGVITKETEAYVWADRVNAARDVRVQAHSVEDIFSVSVSLGVAGTAGIAGSASVYVVDTTTRAYIGDDPAAGVHPVGATTVIAGGSVLVEAVDASELDLIGGNISGAGAVGVGVAAAVPVVSKTTEAFLGPSADVTGMGGHAVSAHTGDFDTGSRAEPADPDAGTEREGKATVPAAEFTPTADVDTGDESITFASAHGFETGDAVIYSQGDDPGGIGIQGGDTPTLVDGETYYVIAGDTDPGLGPNQLRLAATEEDARDGVAIDLDDTSGLSGTHSLTDGVPTVGFTQVKMPGQQLDAGADTDFDGDGSDDLDPDAATQSEVRTSDPEKTDVRGVAVTAVNQDTVRTFGLSGGGAGTVAVNIGGGVSVLSSDTSAFVAGGARVNTHAEDAPTSEQSVLVAAGNDLHHLGIAGAVSIAGTVAVTPGADVTVISNDTRAFIGDTAQVAAAKDVTVVANAREDIRSFSAGIGGSGLVGVGVSASVIVVDNSTRAWIGDDDASDGVGATVRAGGNVLVAARDDTGTFTISGSLGVGLGAAGVGGAAEVLVIHKNTRAFVGHHSSVDAGGNGGLLTGVLDGSNTASGFGLESAGETDAATGENEPGFRGLAVQARSSEDVWGAGASAGGGLYAGVAGGVTVAVIDSDTFALIGAQARINTDDDASEHAEQSVNVSAANEVTALRFAGALGLGAVGIAGGVDVGAIRNDVTASIGAGAEVQARHDVDVNALSRDDVTSYALSLGAGVGALAASVSVWSIGSDEEPDSSYSYEEDNLEDGTTSTQSEDALGSADPAHALSSEDDRAAGEEGDPAGGFGANLQSYDSTDRNGPDDDTPDNTALLGTHIGTAGQEVDASASDSLIGDSLAAVPVGGTSAGIGNGATVVAGNDVSVRADDRLELEVVAGSVSLGGAGLGGSVAVVTIDNHTEAFIGDGAVVFAGADSDDRVLVHADFHEDLDGLAIAGQAGGVAFGAQVIVFNDSSVQSAHIGDSDVAFGPAVIGAAGGGVAVEAAADRTLQARATGGGLAGGGAIGASVAIANAHGSTLAWITDAEIGQDGAVGGVEIGAESTADVAAHTIAVVGGLATGFSGSVALATHDPEIDASIKEDALITVAGDVRLGSRSDADVVAEALGINVAGGAALGASVAIARNQPRMTTAIGRANGPAVSGATISAGGSIVLHAVHNFDASDTSPLDKGADADATAGSGALILGAAGAFARTEMSPTVNTFIGDDAVVGAGDDVELLSRVHGQAESDTTGLGGGAIGVGVSLARAFTEGSTQTGIHAATVDAAGDVSVASDTRHEADADSLAVAGGILSGTGNDSRATVDPDVSASLGAGATISASNDIGVSASSRTDASATTRGVAVGVGAASVSLADANVSPAVTAAVGDGATLTAGRDLEVASLHNRLADASPGAGLARARAESSAGALLGATGASADATAAASTETLVGAAELTAESGNIVIRSLASNRADAEADGATVGIAGIGTSFADATVDSQTRTRVGFGAALTAQQDVVVTAQAIDDGDALAIAGSGGVISGAGADANAFVTPIVQTLIGTGGTVAPLTVAAGDDVRIAALGEAHAIADATGTTIGVGTIGFSDADTSLVATVDAVIDPAATVNAGDLIDVASFFNVTPNPGNIANAAQAIANASGSGVVGGGSSSDGSASSIVNVGTTVAGTLHATGAPADISVTSRAYNQLRVISTGSSGGILTGGFTQGSGTLVTNATVAIADDADLAATDDVLVSSRAHSDVVMAVSGGSGQSLSNALEELFSGNLSGVGVPSIVSAGGAASTLSVANTALTTIGRHAAILAGDRADVLATGRVSIDLETVMYAAGTVGSSASALADVLIDSDALVRLHQDAAIGATHVALDADNGIQADVFSDSTAEADGLPFSVSIVGLDVGSGSDPSEARVSLEAGSRVEARQTLTVEATNFQTDGALEAHPRAEIDSTVFIGTATTRAEGDIRAGATIDQAAGSELKARDLSAYAETRMVLDRNTESIADTIITKTITVIKEVTEFVEETVCEWAPWPLNELCEVVTRAVTKLVEVVEEVTEAATELEFQDGNTITTDAIDLDGDVFNFGTQDRLLVIDRDASGAPVIDPASNLGVTIDDANQRVIVDDIISDATPRMQFLAPFGTISGDAVLHLDKTIGQVEIDNRSDYDLVLQRIEMIDFDEGDPDVTYVAETLSQYEIAADIVESQLDIHNVSASDIVFTQTISNVTGFFDIVNDGGSIRTQTSDVHLEAGDVGHLYMEAAAGDIGSHADPFDVQLVRGKTMPDGSPADMPAELIGLAGGSLYFDVIGYNTVNVHTPGGRADGFALNFTAGGDVDVDIADSFIIELTDGADVVHEASGVYNVYSAVAGTGDVDLHAPDADLRLGAITSFLGEGGITIAGLMGAHTANTAPGAGLVSAVGGDVRLRAGGAIVDANAGALNVRGHNLMLDATAGSIGLAGDPLDIDSSNALAGAVDATATGSIHLFEISGDLGAGAIVSLAGDVVLRSAGGIVDAAGDPEADVSGTNIVLTALGGGIGDAANALEVDTRGGTLTVSAIGDAFVTEATADLVLDAAIVSTGTIILVSPGAILDDDDGGAIDILAPDVVFVAVAGVGTAMNPIETAVGRLEATAGTGGVWVTNSGPLSIGGVIDPIAGVSGAGPIVITATSPLAVEEDVVSAADITLTAQDSPAAGDDLTLMSGAAIRTSGGTVRLRAGDDVFLAAGTEVRAAGGILIEGDFGDADPGTGSSIGIRGQLFGNPIRVTGGADADTITLREVVQGEIDLDGGGGSDHYAVYYSGTGDYRVNVLDSGDAGGVDVLTAFGTLGDDNLLLRANQPGDAAFVAALHGDPAATAERVNYDARIEQLTVDARDGMDRVSLDDNLAPTTVRGGADADRIQVGQLFASARDGAAGVAPGDEFATTETTRGHLSNGASFATTVEGGPGNDELVVLRNLAPLAVAGGAGDDAISIRAFARAGSGAGGSGTIEYVVNAPVTVSGGDGTDRLRAVGTELADSFVITAEAIVGLGRSAGYGAGVEILEVDGAEGDDAFYVLATAAGARTALLGGLGSDRFSAGGDAAAGVGSGGAVPAQAGPHRLEAVQGPLAIDGEGGAGTAGIPADPAMLPGETSLRAADGGVLGFSGTGGAGALDSVEAATADLEAAVARLGLDTVADLAGLALEISQGPGAGRFWQIADITTGPSATTTVTLRNPGQPAAHWGLPDGGSSYAIRTLAGTFFAPEASQTDSLVLFDDGNATGGTGSLTEEAFLGFGMGGPATYGNLETLAILLGTGGDSLAIDGTADGTITAVHGGGGDDAVGIADGGGPASPLVTYGDTSHDGGPYAGRPGEIAPWLAHAFTNPGHDTLDASFSSDGVTLFGGPGDDRMRGSQAGDHLAGGAGDDTIHGEDGRDHIYGDSGFDVDLATRVLTVPTSGPVGEDELRGGGDDDIVIGDHGVIGQADGTLRILTTTAVERIETVRITEGGADVLYGGNGEDVLLGGAAGDDVDGDAGADLVLGDHAILDRTSTLGDTTNPRFRALAGEQIYGRGDIDDHESGEVLVTGDWQENPVGTPGWNDFRIELLAHGPDADPRTHGDDYLAGGAGNDTLFGQLGDDTIQGDGGIEGKYGGEDPVGAFRDVDGLLHVSPSFEMGSDGDDYIEGNGGDDVIFGNLGQDDIIGGSSALYSLTSPGLRPDGGDTIFGGSGERIERNHLVDTTTAGDITLAERHARDADMILGDNGNIYRLVGTNGGDTGAFLEFEYDRSSPIEERGGLRIVVRAAELLDYTPGGPDATTDDAGGPLATGDIGAGDEIHGESGDDFVYGMVGGDVLFGDSEDDDLIGGWGHDWIAGGSGQDGILGDDGRIFTSRNGTAEPLFGLGDLGGALDHAISTPGDVQQATINIADHLRKTADLTPFNPVADGGELVDPLHADDVIYGGLGGDWLHGGAGDDAISGAEALALYYGRPFNPGDLLRYSPMTGEFAEYVEFAPRLEIFYEEGAPHPAGSPFILNFDPTAGPVVSGGTYGDAFTDGDDKLFGDLGNDWLVGGTGRDNLYGGWGDDLLNADDDHTTNADPNGGVGLNDEPDTHPSYEDRAFGGAGRDVLIANTGGDRLIDWAGEFNSYLVPFAPFGLGTVSRMLAPSLAEFLYDLSASDGADPTRGGDPARNGEPDGELGLVKQQDFAWQDQTGAPRDTQPGNIPGGARDVLRSASFDDPAVTGFFADSGVWEASAGALQVSAESPNDDAVSVFHVGDQLPGYFEVQASVQIEKSTGGWKGNAYVIFDYQHERDFKFVGIDDFSNKLVMGHRDTSGWHVDEQASVRGGVKADRFYNMLVAINGTTVTLVVDNKDVFSRTYEARVIDGYAYGLNYGYVGVGSDNSRGTFDNIRVQILPPETTFEDTEDFEDGVADLFTAGGTGEWRVDAGRYGVDPNGAPVMSLLDLGPDRLNFNSLLEMQATVNTQGRAGIVFDRYGEESFKFATIDAANDRLVIGHYTDRGGWAEDEVMSTTIEAGVDYTLGITLKGSTVSATLNAAGNGGHQAIVGHVFNAATVDGAFGLLALDGVTSFDDVKTRTNDGAFLTDDEPLSATSAGEGGSSITADDLAGVLAEAKRRVLAGTTASVAAQAALERLHVQVADLGGLALGRLNGDTITIDADAAGHGWFVDATPGDDTEFRRRSGGDGLTAVPASAAYGRMDLLTGITHELGHVLGLGHDDGAAFMAAGLEPGVRLVPSVDVLGGHEAPATDGEESRDTVRLFDDARGAFIRTAEVRWLAALDAGTGGVSDPYGIDDDPDLEEKLRDHAGEPLRPAFGEEGAQEIGAGTIEDANARSALSTGLSSLLIDWTGRFQEFRT